MRSSATTTESTARSPLWAAAVACLICGAIGLVPASATATVMEYASPGELVELSDVVVRADVVERQSFVDRDQGRTVTHTTLAIRETYLGGVDQRITIEQWGGSVGETTTAVPGDAEFEAGEEVVVFLRRDRSRPDVLFLTALAQSKYTVDRSGSTPVVARDFSNLVVVGQKEGERRELTIDGELLVLADFEAELRALIDEQTGSRE